VCVRVCFVKSWRPGYSSMCLCVCDNVKPCRLESTPGRKRERTPTRGHTRLNPPPSRGSAVARIFEVGSRKRLSGVHRAKKCRNIWGETPCSRTGPHPRSWRSPGRDHLSEWGAVVKGARAWRSSAIKSRAFLTQRSSVNCLYNTSLI